MNQQETTKIEHLGDVWRLTMYSPSNLYCSVYFVIENGKGYLLNCLNGEVGLLFGGNMDILVHDAIHHAINDALARGAITGKVCWVCKGRQPDGSHVYLDWGNHVHEWGLEQKSFEAGTDESISPETKEELHKISKRHCTKSSLSAKENLP